MAEPTMDRRDRVMVALSRFVFPGIAVPRGEMADAVLAAVDDPEEFLCQLPAKATYSADRDLQEQLKARDERVLDLEAEVRQLEEREAAAERRVIAGEGSHQDTALVAIKRRAPARRAPCTPPAGPRRAREFTTAAEYAVTESLEEELVAAMDAAAALVEDADRQVEGGGEHGA